MRGSDASLAAITHEDLHRFAHQVLHPSNLLISVVGDISPEALQKILDSQFAQLHKGDTLPEVSVSDYTAYPSGQTIQIKHPIPQSVAVFGFEGIGYDHPDFFAAYVLNYILGGGSFESRLMNEIREKHGLAYSVYTYLSPLDHTAALKGYVATRNDAIGASLNMVKKVISDIRDDGVTEEEVNAAKRYLMGSFPLKMDSNQKLAEMISFIQLEELGIDYLNRRNDLIAAVTLDDVNRIAATLMVPEKLVTVVVGEIPQDKD